MPLLTLYIGPTGAGKSSAIADDIARLANADPFGPPIFWLVPDGLSYLAERLLLSRIPASLRVEILTIRRFAERASEELGCLSTRPANQTAKRFVLHEILQQEQGRLAVLTRQEPSIALLDSILEAIRELSAFHLSPVVLANWLETVEAGTDAQRNVLNTAYVRSAFRKWKDIVHLYERFQSELATRGLHDGEDLPQLIQSQLRNWSKLHGATVFVDGFHQLDPTSLSFLVEVARIADKTVTAFTLDPDWLTQFQAVPDADLFDEICSIESVYTPQTLMACRALITACTSCDILHEIRRFDKEKFELHSVAVAAAQNPRVEADGVAAEIARLVGANQVSYDDVAIICPDPTLYAPYLRDSLGRFGIPHYVEEFPPLAVHPLARFVLAILDVVETEFALDAVLRLLKSDLCGIEEREVDWLEGYLRTYEVEGASLWLAKTPWHFAEGGFVATVQGEGQSVDERANRLRHQLCEWLSPIYSALSETSLRPSDIANALWTALTMTGAKRVIASWMVNEDATESPLHASLHEQAWDKMLAILTDLSAFQSEAVMPRWTLIALVRDALTTTTLASIPFGVGQVLVTELDRAQGWQARAVFFIGAVDGTLPRRQTDSGILQDEERLLLRRFHYRVGYTTTERQAFERTTHYFVLSRARERFTVTYPLSSADGKAARPAMFVGRVRQSTPGIVDYLWSGKSGMEIPVDGTVLESYTTVWTVDAALEMLAGVLRKARFNRDAEALTYPWVMMLARWVMERDEHNTRLRRLMEGLSYRVKAGTLTPELAKKLYPSPLRGSVNQLETFAACPYQHFAHYGLRLQPDRPVEINQAQRGTLTHDALQSFVRKHMADLDKWREMSDKEAVDSMRQVFDSLMSEPQTDLWRRKAVRRLQAEAVLGLLGDAAIILTEHAKHGTFQPRALELTFGETTPGSLPPFEVDLPLGARLVLRGRIDRVDFTPDGHLRIVDYKSSRLDIDLSRIAHGLQLQLPIYAMVALHHASTLCPTEDGQSPLVAGLLYIPVRGSVKLEYDPKPSKVATERAHKAMQARGLLLQDFETIKAMDARLASGGATDLFKAVFKADLSFRQDAPVISEEDMSQLLNMALQNARQFGERILEGDIAIAPYDWHGQTPCGRCDYQAVCQIDVRRDKRPFRRLSDVSLKQGVSHGD